MKNKKHTKENKKSQDVAIGMIFKLTSHPVEYIAKILIKPKIKIENTKI